MTTVIPKISKLSKRVIRVLGCNPGYFTLQGTNTYILGTGQNRMLIDCGEADVPEYIQNLKNLVKENNICLTKILLSHWHPDHVGGTKSVLNEIAHNDCKVYKFPDNERDSHVTHGQYELNYLQDEDEINVDGATLKVYHTPGHAKDHLVVYLKEEQSLFSGDCILGEGSVVFEDLVAYLNSLDRISSLKPIKLYPGHGPVVDDPEKKVQEYIQKRMEREQQIVNVMETFHQKSKENREKYITIKEIVDIIYPNIPEGLVFGAQWNVMHHLDKLVYEKRVEKLEQEDDIPVYRLKIDGS